MYFPDSSANRRVEDTDYGGWAMAFRLPDIDYVGGEF
jgi:hypothetical protein